MRLLATDEASETIVLFPKAGALLAAKVATVALEFRTAEKRASDGEDIVRLSEAFGSLAVLADLEHATPEERVDLHHHSHRWMRRSHPCSAVLATPGTVLVRAPCAMPTVLLGAIARPGVRRPPRTD